MNNEIGCVNVFFHHLIVIIYIHLSLFILIATSLSFVLVDGFQQLNICESFCQLSKQKEKIYTRTLLSRDTHLKLQNLMRKCEESKG